MRSYLSKRKIKSHQYPFFRCIIPKDLQGNFDGITDFRLSLSCVRNEDTQILCLKLKQITEKVFDEIRSGMKNLSLDDIKEILRIEVRKQIKYTQHYAFGTNVFDNVKKSQSMQNVATQETRLQQELSGENIKEYEKELDKKLEEILSSLGIETNTKDTNYKKLRRTFIKLYLLRFDWIRTLINSTKDIDEDDFRREVDTKLGMGLFPQLHLELQEKLQQSESILGSRILLNDDEVVEVEETHLISKLIDEYISTIERQKDLREKTIIEYRNTLETMVEIIGDFPIHKLSQKHGRLVSTTLEKLPPRRKSNSRYKTKTVQEIVKMDVSNPMDARTVNKLIQRCSTWLNWVVRNGYYEGVNIFHGKSIPSKNRKDAPTRELFSNEQLKLIFNVENYSKKTLNSTSPCKYVFYWVSIFGLYHGLRLQEICQLHMNDIYPLNKLWVIDINEKTTDKKLKTKNAKRIIPLHQTLIDLGFLDYFHILEKKGKERLFHELTLGRDGYTKNPSRYFNDYLRELKIKTPMNKYDFHSFRHTCNNALIQKDVIEEHRNDYLGWEQTGMSKKVYGKPFEPSILKKRCSNVISFPINWKKLGVDWKLILG